MSKKESERISSEEKLAYVEQILLKKKTPKEVSKETSYHEKTVYEWMRKYRENPKVFMPGSGNKKQNEAETKVLEKRVKELEQELEFLKKATAYFIKNPM